METEQYRRARVWGGKYPALWCERLGISRDTDKSYSSGRLRVSDKIAEIVEAYAAEKWQKTLALKATLESALPDWQVVVDDNNLDLTATTHDSAKEVVFHNAGMNNFRDEIYEFGPPNKTSNILIFGKSSSLSPGAHVGDDAPQWFLWKARLKKGSLGRLQNYPNAITSELLAACEDIPFP